MQAKLAFLTREPSYRYNLHIKLSPDQRLSQDSLLETLRAMLLGAASSTSSCCRGCGQLDSTTPACTPVGHTRELSPQFHEQRWPVLTTAHIWMLEPAHPSAGSDSRALSRADSGQQPAHRPLQQEQGHCSLRGQDPYGMPCPSGTWHLRQPP